VQNPFSHPRSTRRVPALAGAGLALSLVLPGVAAAQDPAPGDITAIPVEAAGSCGTVTVSSTGVDGSETVEVIDGGTCEPIILGQAQALPGASTARCSASMDRSGRPTRSLPAGR
jgi:hypothetical protein